MTDDSREGRGLGGRGKVTGYLSCAIQSLCQRPTQLLFVCRKTKEPEAIKFALDSCILTASSVAVYDGTITVCKIFLLFRAQMEKLCLIASLAFFDSFFHK